MDHEWLIKSAHTKRVFITVRDVQPRKNVASLIQLICDQARADKYAPTELKNLKYGDIWLSATPHPDSELDLEEPLEACDTGIALTTFYYHLKDSCDCEIALPPIVDRMEQDNTDSSDSESSVYLNNNEMHAVPEEEEDIFYEPLNIRNPKLFNYDNEEDLKDALQVVQKELDACRSISIDTVTDLLIVDGFPRGMSNDDMNDHLEDIFSQLRNPPKGPYFSVMRGHKGTVFLGISTPRWLYEVLADKYIAGVPELDMLHFYSIPMTKMPRMLRETRSRAKRQ